MADMSALATIFNPLLSSGRELWTFYNTNTGDLALRQRKNLPNPAELFYEGAAKQTGIIHNPSSLVVLLHDGMVNVYGFAVSTSVADEPPSLKLLSPAVAKLARIKPTKQFCALTGMTDGAAGGNNAWLYFLDQNDNDRVVVCEYKVGSNDPPKKLPATAFQTTFLASTYSKRTGAAARLIVYQSDNSDDNSLWMFDAASPDKPASQLPNTSSAQRGTPIAACTAKDGQGLDVVYVYFTDDRGRLWKTVIADSPTDTNDILEAPKVASWSQIAVKPGPKGNFVSYVTRDGDRNVVHIFEDGRS